MFSVMFVTNLFTAKDESEVNSVIFALGCI